eukprot:1488771-Prymnesium_polylepis.1
MKSASSSSASSTTSGGSAAAEPLPFRDGRPSCSRPPLPSPSARPGGRLGAPARPPTCRRRPRGPSGW